MQETQETQIWSLHREDSLEKEMGPIQPTPQYSCLENTMDRGSLGSYNPWDHKESDMTECAHVYTNTHTNTHTHLMTEVLYIYNSTSGTLKTTP